MALTKVTGYLLGGQNRTISADITITADLIMAPGDMFTVAANKTLTITGAFQAGLYQVFDCSATGASVVFGSGAVSEVYPEWWGVDGTAISKAISSSNIIKLQYNKTYDLGTTTISIPANTTILGNNALCVVSNVTGAFKTTGSNINLIGVGVENNYASGCIGIDIGTGTTNLLIENCTFQCTSGYKMQSINLNAIGCSKIRVINNRFDNVAFGWLSNQVAYDLENVIISGNMMTNLHGDGIELNHPIYYAPRVDLNVGRALESLTSSGTTATATLTNHGLSTNDYIMIQQASVSNFNKDGTLITVTGVNTFTYTITDAGSVSATGAQISQLPYHSAHDFVISDNTIEINNICSGQSGLGIGIAGAWNVSVTGNTIKDYYRRGIHIEDNCRHITITGNVVRKNPSTTNAFAVEGGTNYCSGIWAIGGDYISIVGNTVYNAIGDGISVFASTTQLRNASIANNTVYNSGKNGFYFDGDRILGQQNIVISGNIFKTSTTNGMQFINTISRVVICHSNIVDGAGAYGIIVPITVDNHFENNRVYNATSGRYHSSGANYLPATLTNDAIYYTDTVASNTLPTHGTIALSKGAYGVLTVKCHPVTNGDYNQSKQWLVSFDGTTLTATLIATYAASVHAGAVTIATPTVSSGVVQIAVTTSGLDGKECAVSVEFVGQILYADL